MARKTKAEALETRSQILDAAVSMFRQRGVARTSLQDVADAAGLTRGAIYWHFKDKADLFSAMMNRAVLPIEQAVDALLASPPDDPLATLARLAIDPMWRLQASPEMRQVFFIATRMTEYTDELMPVLENKRASTAAYIGHLQSMVERAAERDLLAPGVVPCQAAHGLYALVDGLLRFWIEAKLPFDLVKTADAAVGAYLAGISTPATASPSTARATPPRKTQARRARPTSPR